MPNTNSLNPAAYTYVVKAPVYYQKYADSLTEEHVLNRKQPNGRINSDKLYGDFYTAVSVSPYHPLFHTQVEKGIRNLVYALLDKNYFTISSCEGHRDSPSYIRIALVDSIDKDSLMEHFPNLPYVTYKVIESASNAEIYSENNTIKVRPLDPNKFSKKAETAGINKLFCRNHDSYYFFDIIFYGVKHPWWDIISLLKIKYHRFKNFNKTKQTLIDIIKSEQFPVYYK